MTTTLRTFLSKHKKDANQAHTHTWFASGARHESIITLHVPSEHESTLRELIAIEAKRVGANSCGNALSISEKLVRGKPFRFVADLDFKPSDIYQWQNANGIQHSTLMDALTDKLKDVIALYTSTVADLTGIPNVDLILATRLPYKLHLFFPSVITDLKGATSITNTFKARFAETHPDIFNDHVVDASIYSTGLRTLYCHKGGMTKAEKRDEERKEHELLFGKGTHTDVYYITDQETWHQDTEARVADLAKTSVIVSADTELTYQAVTSNKRKVKTGGTAKKSRQNVAASSSNSLNENVSSLDTLIAFICEVLNLDRNKIKAEQPTERGNHHIIATHICECPFAKRTHQSNHLYVVISSDGIELRCHDEQCTESKTIPFASIPAHAAAALCAVIGIDNLEAQTQRSQMDLTTVQQLDDESRLSQVESAVQAFTQNSGQRTKQKLVLHPLMEEVKYSNHRVTIPCAQKQHCPIHDKVHDSATCWMEVGLQGYMELRCSIDPHLYFPNPPFMLQNVNNFFQQVNVNVNVLPSKEDTSFQKYRNIVLQACARAEVRKDREGNLFRRVRPELSYAYENFTTIREFVQDTLRDNVDALEDPNSIDKMTKLLSDQRTSSCDFIQRDRHFLGFSDGVFEIVNCCFTPRETITEDLVVRKYFDQPFDEADIETPSFDRLLRLQLPSDAGYNIMLVLIGRLFFWIGERDNWQVMTYVMGDQAGTGKSLLIDTVKAMFSNVGAISSNFEAKFGLSSLVDKEVIITDDLPKKIQDVLDQQLFQTMVSGGIVNVPTKNNTAPSLDWKVQQLYGGNWHLGYIDKGQISRRVATIPFDKTVTEVDTTLKARILAELPKVMHKCLKAYRDALNEHGSASFWSFCPTELLETKDDMRATCNPLYTFLRDSPSILYEEGARTNLKDLTAAFSTHMKKEVKKLDRVTFSQVNPEFIVDSAKACKACLSIAGKGCCPAYLHGNRTTVLYVTNLRLVT